MGLNVRDWMVIAGVVLIVAVILDGFRRVRKERRNNIRMSLNKQFLNSAEGDESFTSELPAGGARVIDRDTGNIDLGDQQLNEPALDNQNSFAEESSEDDFDEIVPVLTDTSDDNFEEEDSPEEIIVEAVQVEEPEAVAKGTVEQKQNTADSGDREVLIINVIARDGGAFKGPDLLHILLACDMRYGDMSIFHRYEGSDGKGSMQFSVASIKEPGTFDLDAIDDFSTEGVCFFLNLPGPEDPLQAFDCMVETAHCLVKNLEGEMRDESHSVMTNQTLEHFRQHLIERERRQMAQHA